MTRISIFSQSIKPTQLGLTLPLLLEEEWQAPQSIPGSQQCAYVTIKIQQFENPPFHPRRAATTRLIVRKMQAIG